ncbi:MAG TPA: DNA helicase UvrD, partial [Gammaproteobacteria bacterium]|nr:DNA helicase UvrD [Gammaproteobacteria bacterium]
CGSVASATDPHGERYADQLHQYGLPETSIEFAARSVATTLQRCVEDSRGRWLLVGGDSNQSEYALTRWQQGVMRRFVIDRTFIDQQGVRWIVDYKTGYRAGGDVEGFLDQEQQRYQDQLQGYAELFRALEARPVKLGLYFPRMGGWREWTPA